MSSQERQFRDRKQCENSNSERKEGEITILLNEYSEKKLNQSSLSRSDISLPVMCHHGEWSLAQVIKSRRCCHGQGFQSHRWDSSQTLSSHTLLKLPEQKLVQPWGPALLRVFSGFDCGRSGIYDVSATLGACPSDSTLWSLFRVLHPGSCLLSLKDYKP